jgi:CcmD family protein
MMETLNYMMAGYLVIWGLAFGFVFNLWSRSRRLESELEHVRQLVDDLDQERS